MEKIITKVSAAVACVCLAVSCGGPKFLASYAPEESGLSMMKITDEAANTVAGNVSSNYAFDTHSAQGICTSAGFTWSASRLLDMSPSGTELAYVTILNDQWNIMIRKAGPQGTSTQRTFRSVSDFSWGQDGKLYSYPVGEGSDSFICVRNSSFGTSELWLVNYEKGQETLILTDKNRGFTNPVVSPDGQWILCQGNSKSSISKRNNLDIFAVKMDGTGFIQLTYHPADDCCPVWSPDGKYIYFISSRANEHDAFNIWRMRFDL